jgi:hypothetical protein
MSIFRPAFALLKPRDATKAKRSGSDLGKNKCAISPRFDPTTLKMAASEKRASSVERHQHTVEHIDSAINDEKPIEQDGKRDWTGTTRKTDPEEIRLVRKLDYRIMVRER